MIRWVVGVSAVIAIPGCDAVFGLDELTASDAAIPAVRVTGHDRSRTIENDANGHPTVVDQSFAPGLVTLSAGTDAGAVPLVQHPDGTFELEVPAGERYQLVIDRGGETVELQTAARTIELARTGLGRAGRTAIVQPSPLQVAMTGAGSTGLAQVRSTGVFASTQHDSMTGSLTDFAVDWRDAETFPAADAALIDSTQNDRLYYSRFEVLAAGEPYLTIAEFAESATLVQLDGSTTMFAATAIPAPRDRCVHPRIGRFAERDRLANAWPFTPTTGFTAWRVVATIQPAVNRNGAHMLAGYPDVRATGPEIDQDIAFGNIYPGTQLAVTLLAVHARPYTFVDATPVTLATVSEHTVPFDDVRGCETIDVTGTIGLPTLPRLAGSSLSNDGIAIEIDRTRRVPLAWEVTGGPVDVYSAVLSEVSEANGAMELRTIRTFIGDEPSFALEPSLFLYGHAYVFTLLHQVGFPGAATGDFTGEHAADAPTSTTSTTTSMFIISNGTN